jgi:hypothetical protein
MKLKFKLGGIIQVYKRKGFSKIVDIVTPDPYGQLHPVDSIEYELGTNSNTIVRYVTKLHENGSEYKASDSVHECLLSQCYPIDSGYLLKMLDSELQQWKLKKLNLMKLLDIPPNVWDEYLK